MEVEGEFEEVEEAGKEHLFFLLGGFMKMLRGGGGEVEPSKKAGSVIISLNDRSFPQRIKSFWALLGPNMVGIHIGIILKVFKSSRNIYEPCP